MKPRHKRFMCSIVGPSSGPRQKHNQRSGNAVTEFALVAPVLVVLLMGAMDVGQAVNVAQVVNDASREGARWATRADVKTASEVEAAVQAYLGNAFPGMSSGELSASATVNVSDDAGTVAGGDLTTIESGNPVSVEVVLQYEDVRWTVGFAGLTGTSMRTTTVMRRE